MTEVFQIIEYLTKSMRNNIDKINKNALIDSKIFKTKALAII